KRLERLSRGHADVPKRLQRQTPRRAGAQTNQKLTMGARPRWRGAAGGTVTQNVEVDGGTPEVSEDFSQSEIWRALASAPESPGVAADVAKQLGAGLVTGLEAIPAAPAHLLGAIGEWGGRKLEEFAPALFSADQQTEQNRQKLKELIAANRGGGI